MAELTTSSAPAAGAAPGSPSPLTNSCEEAMRQCTDAMDQCWLETQDCVKKSPMTAVCVAFIAGIIMGLILRGGCGKRD